MEGGDEVGGVAREREVEVRGGGLLVFEGGEQAQGAAERGAAAGVEEHECKGSGLA